MIYFNTICFIMLPSSIIQKQLGCFKHLWVYAFTQKTIINMKYKISPKQDN